MALLRRGIAIIFVTLILMTMVLMVNYAILIERRSNNRNNVYTLCELLDIIETIVHTADNATLYSYVTLLNESLKLTIGVIIREVGIERIDDELYIYMICTDGYKGYILIRKL
ncbi:MAG: hypothetical protein QXH96_01345 [Candidatus Geothermarchaeota archaeon]